MSRAPGLGDVIEIRWVGDGVTSTVVGIVTRLIPIPGTDGWEFTLGVGPGQYTLEANPSEITILTPDRGDA